MKPELKKLLILNAPYLLFVYLFDKIGQAVRLSPGADLSGKVLSLADGFSAAFANPLPSLAPMDLLIGIVGAVLIRLIVYVKGKNAKKYRKGIEYGSARWGNAEDIKPYTDPVFQNNVLLTQTERLTMNSRPKQPKYARNKNILVIGGSGSGKTRFFVKPNLMQMHSSYVVTDPKGTVLVECGKLLQRGGYRIKVLNTINFKKSMKYNPFAYLRSEKDILKLVNTLIANTKGDGEKAGEDFWIKSERLFYCALIGYIWYEAPEEEKNFTTLLEMINASEAREDDPEFQSPVDLMFERLEEKDPEHFAVRQYKKFLLSAGKTRSSILISCGARLAPFDIKELRDLMETDEMELDTIGDRKTALFVIISDTDDTFNFVVSIRTTTDEEGNEEEYEYRILNVKLTNKPIASLAEELLNPQQFEMFKVYLQTQGNKPLIFGGGSPDGSPSEDLSGVEFVNGTRPGNPEFMELAKQQVGNVGGYPYWSWYGFNSRVEWCACFVSWCYNQAGKSEPRFAGCEWQGVPWFQSRGQWGARGYENIAPGDAIFFDWDLDGVADHVGLVLGRDGSRVYTVEGNSGDACKIKSYDLNYQCIKGYGLMNW